MTQTFKAPPMHPTTLSPTEIIGVNNMRLFEQHYEIASRSTNGGDFPIKVLNNKIGSEDRENIAKTLSKLREFGFYPLGYKDSGGIKWGVVLKSEAQVLMESKMPELEQYSEKELMEMARKGWNPLVKGVAVDKVQDYEMNYQEETA